MRIPKPLALALAVAAMATALVVQLSAASLQRPNQRSISVLVLGRGDAVVPDLTEKDFTIREDGAVREILRVAPAPPPSHLVLLIDDSQVTTPFFRELRTTLHTFVNTMADASPAPAVRLTTFGDRPTVLADFSTSFSLVSRGIDRIQPRPGSGATFLEALIETARDLRTRKITNAVLVAFVAEEGPEFSNVQSKMVADALRDVSASLWTITLRDRDGGGVADAGRERAAVLGDVTVQSGGRDATVLSDQNLASAFSRLADQLLSRYEITYGRPETLVPPSRLEVTARDRSWKLQVSRWAAE